MTREEKQAQGVIVGATLVAVGAAILCTTFLASGVLSGVAVFIGTMFVSWPLAAVLLAKALPE